MARFRKGFKENKVVRGFLGFAFNMGCKLSKSLCVVALVFLQKSHNSFEFFILKLFIDVLEILSSIPPVLNFFQRSRILIFVVGIRIRDNLFDLTIPLNDNGFKSFDEVFILAISQRKIFLWNVELSVSFFLKAGFSNWDHEFVELSEELFFDIVRPWALIHYAGDEDWVHES